MKLYLTLLVRDEADILALNLEHHLPRESIASLSQTIDHLMKLLDFRGVFPEACFLISMSLPRRMTKLIG